jgi:hypothetical protein
LKPISPFSVIPAARTVRKQVALLAPQWKGGAVPVSEDSPALVACCMSARPEYLRHSPQMCDQGRCHDLDGADDYPSRPIKLMVGASPGGTTDTMAIAPPLASSLGRPVLVENRPGAGGSLAADAVAKSAPDGYTLLVSFSSHTINATLYPKLPFDPVTDFTPISMIAVTHRRVDRLTRDTMPQPDISQPIR